MPIIKSAKKRVRVAKRATLRNVKTKRGLKSAVKALQAAVNSDSKVSEAHAKAQSALGKAGKKNLMHKNKVARKQRQLAKLAKTAAKSTAKKAAPKKTTAKKPATNK